MLRSRILRGRPLLSTFTKLRPRIVINDSDRTGRLDAKKNDPTVQRVKAPPPRSDKVSHRTKRTDAMDQPSQFQEGTMQCNAPHCKSSKKIIFFTQRIRRRIIKTPPDKKKAIHTGELILSMKNLFTNDHYFQHKMATSVCRTRFFVPLRRAELKLFVLSTNQSA